jgi:hypothetical protein
LLLAYSAIANARSKAIVLSASPLPNIAPIFTSPMKADYVAQRYVAHPSSAAAYRRADPQLNGKMPSINPAGVLGIDPIPDPTFCNCAMCRNTPLISYVPDP